MLYFSKLNQNRHTIMALLNRILTSFIVIIFSILICCVVWQVISRYVLGSPSIFTDEIARFLFMWVGLIGAAYATGLKQHIAIDLLLMKQQGKRKTFLELLILIIMSCFAAIVLIYGGLNLALDTYRTGQISPSLGLSMGIVYLCLPLSGGIMLVYLLADIVQKIAKFKDSEV
ncbi:C4-dicarboxylate ABC transporter permease [Pasteurellaceae bacterium Macca]|nr:C4-dicarboxylate ABC transporter permease [Pasteurellaceae bacterium Macca]